MKVFQRLTLPLLTILITHGNSKPTESGFRWKNLKQNYCFHDEEYQPSSEPIKVDVSLFILSIFDISVQNMEFGVQVSLVRMWNEPNLIINGNESQAQNLPPKILNCIWKPTIMFYNAKQSDSYEDTGPNTFNWLVRRNFVTATRYKLLLSCIMDFHLYPMDSQFCSLDLMSLPSINPSVEIQWYDLMSKENYALGFNNFKPLNYIIKVEGMNSSLIGLGTTKNKCLHLNLLFVRSLVASIVNVYIPSFLIVCLSMVSFWLDIGAVPGRVTLGVTAILTLATEIVHARASLPTLDYMTALDVWLLGCLITVFLSLIEFTMAQASNRNSTNIKKMKQSRMSDASSVNNGWTLKRVTKHRMKSSLRRVKAVAKKTEHKENEADHQGQKDNMLDRVSRYIFPLAFTSFTVMYWIYFLKQYRFD